MKENKFLDKIAEIFFPHNSCPFCGKETPNGDVCKNCVSHKISPKYCQKCGEHVGEEETICYECKEIDRVFDKNMSCYVYDEVTSGAIMNLKYKEAKYLAKDFAKLLYTRFLEEDFENCVVTSVPMSAQSQKKRAYNHAEEIAKEFCKLSNLTYDNLLVKIKDTPRQAELSRQERTQNLKDSFVVVDKQKVKGKNILIIDDVFTTGSTMTACATALRKAKATKVYCLTVAKTKNLPL